MRKHNYVVGYGGEGQCIYGRGDRPVNFIAPLTLFQVKKEIKQMASPEKAKIFRLVEERKSEKGKVEVKKEGKTMRNQTKIEEEIIKEIDEFHQNAFPKKFYLWSERGFWLQALQKALSRQREEIKRVIDKSLKLLKKEIKPLPHMDVRYRIGYNNAITEITDILEAIGGL